MENCSTPVKAMSFHSDEVFGSGMRRVIMTTRSIADASRNLADANAIGGRSSSPILINIQVVPQIAHRISQTIIFIVGKQPEQ